MPVMTICAMFCNRESSRLIALMAAGRCPTDVCASMEDEITELYRSIDHYQCLLKNISDEQVRRELERLIEEAQQRLQEIERTS